MTALQSMISKLEPLGVYNLEEGSNIYNELCAYAAALDVHRENIDTALRESFISTSESYGILSREKVIGDSRDSYTLAERRNMLILRKCLSERDFTVAAFAEFMESFGVNSYRITEIPSQYSITVKIEGSYSAKDAAWIRNQIALVLPAHLNAYIYFGGIAWAQLDAYEDTFSEIDALDRTWQTFDNI